MRLPREVEETSSLVRLRDVKWNQVAAELAELAAIVQNKTTVAEHSPAYDPSLTPEPLPGRIQHREQP